MTYPGFIDHVIALNAGTTTLSLPSITYADGDTLVMILMHRDTLTTPSGWTLLETVGPVVGSPFNQRISSLKRVMSGSGSLSQSVVQGSSQRFAGYIARFSGATDATARADLRASGTKAASAAVTTSAKGSGKVVVWGAAQELWAPAGADATSPWAPSADGLVFPNWTPIAAIGNQPRLGVFIDGIRASGARTFTPANTTGADHYTLLAVEVAGTSDTVDPKRFINVSGTATPIQ